MSFIVFFLHYQFLFILFKLVKLIKHISINILSFFFKKKNILATLYKHFFSDHHCTCLKA